MKAQWIILLIDKLFYLILEQNGATFHTCKSSIHLLGKLFSNDRWIQNPSNSPYLAYPKEDLWGIIKPRIKSKNQASIEEVKKQSIKEWSSIPQNLIQNLCKNYLDKIKKVFDLKGQVKNTLKNTHVSFLINYQN